MKALTEIINIDDFCITVTLYNHRRDISSKPFGKPQSVLPIWVVNTTFCKSLGNILMRLDLGF